jgi:hypothetical protein
MRSSIPERTVESWVAMELEVWFRNVRLWAPTQNAVGNWDLAAQGHGKLLIFECKGSQPLKEGHSIPINLQQLDRYVNSSEFAAVASHVFYVLPAPPWPGEAPSPGGPFTPAKALPSGHADQRLAGPGGGCWEWFHVVSALSLWTSLASPTQPATPVKSRSVNTRQLPNPPGLHLKPHRSGLLPETERLGDFLEGVAKCRVVPLTGEITQSGSLTGGQGDAQDEPWRRPSGRDSDGPPLSSEETEESHEPPQSPRDRISKDKWSKRSTPTPLAAFLPSDSLAI